MKIDTFQLANGLKVILAPLDNVEASCVMLYHLTGVRNDPVEIKGASFLYQTLMLGGTRNLDPMDRVLFIRKYGGSGAIRINYDYSVFCQLVPDTDLNNALWFESERISSLRIEDDAVDRLKKNIYRRSRYENDSNIHYRAGNWVKAAVFQGTIYQTPLHGNLEKLAVFDNRKVKAVYDNFRDLSNIIMVVSGKFDVTRVKADINKHFNLLSSPGKPVRQVFTTVKPRTKYVYKNWVEENVSQPFTIYGIRAPSMKSGVYIHFDFLRYYLVDQRVSRLERMLNQRNNLDVALSYEFTDHIESNALVIRVSAARRITLERAKYVITKELAACAGRAISASDLKMIKELMEIDHRKNMRDLKKRSFLLAQNYQLGLYRNIDFTEEYLARLRRITGVNIMRVSQRYLAKENQVILNVYPKEGTP